LLLAGIGVFGLLAESVAQRRREIGIRIATGANHRRVVLEIVRKGLAITIAGLAVGIGAALSGLRIVDSLLFGVRPNDPVTLTTAATALVIVAVVASLVPALRAARIDPVIALRGE
jgi:ABC-type antimicrobial peptide transport system permease subunit